MQCPMSCLPEFNIDTTLKCPTGRLKPYVPLIVLELPLCQAVWIENIDIIILVFVEVVQCSRSI